MGWSPGLLLRRLEPEVRLPPSGANLIIVLAGKATASAQHRPALRESPETGAEEIKWERSGKTRGRKENKDRRR